MRPKKGDFKNEKSFEFNLSTKIEFGQGKLSTVGICAAELKAKEVLVITDTGLSQTEIIATVKNSLAKEGIDFTVYFGVKENSRDIDIQKFYDSLEKHSYDAVIACGGGSCMDFSKAISTMLTNGRDIAKIINPNKPKNIPIPLIAIPTTAGTGSEVTSFAVITLDKEQRKGSIFDDKIRPTVAINDPYVLKSLPTGVAAATGMDALTHAIEAYTCTISNSISDGMALHAIRLIAENIESYVKNRTEEECHNMMAASLMAGIAFGFSDVAGVHCMAESLGGVYDTPHGIANSIFLPLVFEYNIEADVKRHRDVSVAMGIDPHNKDGLTIASEGAALLRQMAAKINIPKLRELKNINLDEFGFLAENCMKNVSLKSNIRELTKEDFIYLYNKAYQE